MATVEVVYLSKYEEEEEKNENQLVGANNKLK
jgi:hypothetical protein